MRERFTKPTESELRTLRSVDPVALAAASHLNIRTTTRLVAGMAAQRATLQVALQAVEALRASEAGAVA